jgi:hypothetical protein
VDVEPGIIFVKIIPSEMICVYFVKIIIFTVIFWAVVWIFASNKYEKYLVLSITKSIRAKINNG